MAAPPPVCQKSVFFTYMLREKRFHFICRLQAANSCRGLFRFHQGSTWVPQAEQKRLSS